jgi:hypothetical protein
MFSPKEVPNIRQITSALANLSKPLVITAAHDKKIVSCTQGRYLLISRKKAGAQRYKALHCERLRALAIEWGMSCDVLDRFAGEELAEPVISDDGKVIKFPGVVDEVPPPPPNEEVA